MIIINPIKKQYANIMKMEIVIYKINVNLFTTNEKIQMMKDFTIINNKLKIKVKQIKNNKLVVETLKKEIVFMEIVATSFMMIIKIAV